MYCFTATAVNTGHKNRKIIIPLVKRFSLSLGIGLNPEPGGCVAYSILNFYWSTFAGSGSRAVWGVGLRPLACWDCGYESHRGHWCLLGVLCLVRSLRRADHSSIGVLPTVVRRCVWSRNLVNVEALAHWGECCAKNKQTNAYSTPFNIKIQAFLFIFKQEF